MTDSYLKPLAEYIDDNLNKLAKDPANKKAKKDKKRNENMIACFMEKHGKMEKVWVNIPKRIVDTAKFGDYFHICDLAESVQGHATAWFSPLSWIGAFAGKNAIPRTENFARKNGGGLVFVFDPFNCGNRG